MAVFREPSLAVLVEVVARPVVDDQEHLAATAAHDLLQEVEESGAVEYRGELVQEPRSRLQRHHAEDVGGLAHPEGIYTRLLTHPSPGLVERAIEPEARLVAEGNDATALSGFFLIAGKVWRSQVAWRARSARARRLRGRCTEKPSWCNSRGTWWLW